MHRRDFLHSAEQPVGRAAGAAAEPRSYRVIDCGLAPVQHHAARQTRHSNDRMMAINFTDPLARTDDAVAQPNRSSTEDQRRELGEAIKELKRRTGAARVALVGNSRGGNSIRSYIKNGGGADVSHAVLCGVPNHGVYDWDDRLGSEFNGRGPFLRGLNAGDSEVTPGTAFLTLRSDGIDKYAQADGRFVGKPGTPTGITSDGPALKGATNLVLGAIDHRETAFHPRAFREIYKFIAGREPGRIAIAPEAEVKLSGLVTGTPGGVQTNRPVAGASVDVHRVSPDTGERLGGPIHSSQTGADGRWGPAQVDPTWYLEIVLTSPGSTTTHLYRSPFPRSSDIVHLRAARPLGPADAGAGAVVILSRPRGYFGLPRDVVLLDGKEPSDVKAGRADRFDHHLAASGRRSRTRGRRAVQRGADRRAGLAGLGEQDCDRRTDLLAVASCGALSAALMAPGFSDLMGRDAIRAVCS